MDKMLHKLRAEIINRTDFEESELFEGANLVITNDKNRNHLKQDVIVYSENAENLSWVVFRLKEIFDNKLNSVNKLSFYPHIGKLLNEAIRRKLKIKEQMIYVIENIGTFE